MKLSAQSGIKGEKIESLENVVSNSSKQKKTQNTLKELLAAAAYFFIDQIFDAKFSWEEKTLENFAALH